MSAQEILQQLDGAGAMDWSLRVIRSTGASTAADGGQDRRARIEALENAKAHAAANLLIAIKALLIDGTSTAAEIARAKQGLPGALTQVARQFTITDTRSLSDMSVEVDAEIPLSGRLSDLFAPATTGGGPLRLDDVPRSPLSLLPWPECRTVPAGVKLVIPRDGLLSYGGKPYTGLIVDATNTDLAPALFPKIKNTSGVEVYGFSYIDRRILLERGMVGYKRDLKLARKDPRVGSMPLVICAGRASGARHADVVVSDNDAVLIHAAAKLNDFLARGNVVFVLSRGSGS